MIRFPELQFSARLIAATTLGIMGGLCAPLQAQTATNTVIAIGPSAQGIVQAGDGNLYAPSLKAFVACVSDATMECAYIYKITPAGVVTALHSFQEISVSTGPTAPNTDGIWPTALLVGIDGNLYGACKYGGPGGFGTIFEIPLTGTNAGNLVVLTSFGSTGTAVDPGNQPSSLIQTSDGSFYFTNGVGIYQLVIGAASNTVNTLYTFPIDPKTQLLTNGSNAASLTQASDGDLYMPLWTGPEQTAPSDGATGGIGDYNPTSGGFRSYGFPADGSDGSVPDGPLVEGSDGAFYGITRDHTTVPLRAFRVTTGGAISPVYSFPATGNSMVQSALFLGSDGNFYGTTLLGGDTTSTNCTPTGCGTVFQLTPGGALTTLHNFEGGTPTSTVVAQNPQVDGAAPEAPLVQANDGNFYGTSLFNVVFKITPTLALAAPVQVTVNPAQVAVGQTATLTWKVLNAFSATDQLCGAVVQGGATGGGNWSGVQTGTLTNGVYSGSATIKPTAAGNYTYALVCGGKEAGFATLNVTEGFVVTTISMTEGTVNKPYSGALAAVGGQPGYLFEVSNLPTGLTLNQLDGTISGTPKQFGNYVLDVTVTDAATPPNKATAAVPFNIVSGLEIKTTAAIKGTVGANYLQWLHASGGLVPYTWSITAGMLPDGLQLIPATGAITGTPTTVGNSVVTFQVADGEGTPATETVELTIKIVPSIQIAAVEFTQAIQQYQVLDDLLTSLTQDGEPPVPIISGKFAAMRVYFTNVKDSTDVTLNVTGGVVGQRAMNLPPSCPPDSERIHKNMCPSMDFYFTPQSGPWSAVLTLNDDQGNQLEQETLTVTSRDTASIYYKGLGVCSIPNQPSSCQSPWGLQGLIWFAQKIMPTNNVHADIITRKVYRDLSKFVDSNGNPDPISWEKSVLNGINDFVYSPADAQADANLNQHTDYVGLYTNSIDQTGWGRRPGNALVIPNETTRQGVEATAQVLGHETGHTLDLPHTGVQVPPGDTVGTCWGPGGLPDPPYDNAWIYSDDYIRSFMNGYEYGFDPAAQTVIAGANVLNDGTSQFDVMSYCMPRWISPFNYKNLITTLNGGIILSPNVKVGTKPLADVVKPKRLVTYAQGSYWSITGSIPATGIALDPIFTETMTGTSDPGTGTYSIEELGAGGQVLFTRYFNPAAMQTDTTGTDQATDPQFAEYIPVTPGVASIAILDPTGSTLTSVAITGTAPSVSITSPAAGFVGSGQQTVSWTATSTAATLTSRINYSIDGGTTWQGVVDTTDASAVLDFNTLPGAAAALIRVDVSDGVNTGSATSAAFSVPKKAPASIVIDNPVSGAILPAANPVLLAGAADDPDDGALTGAALQWSDNVQGNLGSGSPLVAQLNPGPHTITLTATDSDGNAITATTQITLGGAAPVVTLTTSQAAGCTDVTINASPGSQGANLALVGYSIDGGNTYTAIPLTGLPLTMPIAGAGTFNVVAIAGDASGQVSSQSQQVTGCTATTAKANAGSGQSALVGSAFGTKLSTLILDPNGNPVSGASVSYTAPATGASATLSSATAVTNASGIATITATANGVAGSYTVTASTQSSTAPATFSLTNSDFKVSAGSASLTISPGSSAPDTISLTALGGFNGMVTFSCSGTPANATCTFAPPTVTPTAATASTTMTISVAQSAAVHWPAGGASVLACCILGLIVRRRRWIAIVASSLLAIGVLTMTGCGGSSSSSSPAGPSRSTITVTGTSGSVQRTTTVSVLIQ
jgi:uncharacterized repeat protein (TIGR03803 family)